MKTKKTPYPTGTGTGVNKNNSINLILAKDGQLNNEPYRLNMKIGELESKVDLFSLISEKHNIVRSGRHYRVNPCPVCNHHDHFTVYPETNSYSSFSNCCSGGSVYRYLQEVEGMNEAEARATLNELAGNGTYKPTINTSTVYAPSKEQDFTNFVMKCYEGSSGFREDMLKTFLERGISVNEIDKYKLSIYRDKDGKRALFPIWSKGKVVYYEARALDGQKPKYKKPTGTNQFFNADYLNEPQNEPIFVTEGIMDALSLEYLGYKAISINGVNFVHKFLELIQQNEDAQNNVFLVAFDNDDAGKEASEKLPFKKIEIPAQYEDVNEWLIGSYQSQESVDDVLSIETSIKTQLEAVTATETAKELLNGFNEEQVIEKDSPTIDLKEVLGERYLKELEKIVEEWKERGGRGRKPSTISPIRCAVVLQEYISFALFDLEENTRLAMYQPKEGTYTNNTTLIKRVISWLEPSFNENKANEVIYHLTNQAPVKERTASRYLIPVNNGVFNLKTKTLEPFNPDYVFTSKIATNYVDNVKNPIIDGWDVESWLNSIACNDNEIVHLLWQVISDSLNGNYTRKKAIFLLGEGNNGKGTFQELITNLIGAKNIATLKVNEFDERFKLSLLEGKTCVIGDDVPAGVYIDDSSNFNSVVTGDRVIIEQKNKPVYSTVFRCSVIQSTNDMPRFKNKTQGTLRRIIIVPFNADFNGEVENFKIKDEYIKDEKVLQYVLHKAINMDFEKFDVPKASQLQLEEFKQDNDPILDFKLNVFDHWNLKEIPKYVVYEFYKRFCTDNGYKFLSDRKFHKQFKSYVSDEWTDGQKRFVYTDLIDELGDLDLMGIGFPSKNDSPKTYKKSCN